MRWIVRPLLFLAALGAAAACGGDSGPRLTADEYAAQGNAVCKAGDVKLGEAGKDLLKDTNTTPEQLAKFFKDHAVPIANEKLDGLAKLRPPAKSKDKAKKMVAAGRKATKTVGDGLKKSGAAYLQAKAPDPFKDFNDLAKDLKLNDCAGTTK